MLQDNPQTTDSAKALASQARLSEVATALADIPKQTQSANGLPADPLNFAFVGTAAQLHDSLIKQSWVPSHQGLRGDLIYGVDTVFRKVDQDAPVSNLLLLGRKQDMAFEQAESTTRRHHLRAWKVGTTADGQDLWVGAATHDIAIIVKPNYLSSLKEGVAQRHLSPGLLLPTTHQIDARVDEERDKVAADLATADNTVLGAIVGFGQAQGVDGDGVVFTTDGQLTVIVNGRKSADA